MEKTLKVEGMSCKNCVKRVKKIIEGAGGTSKVEVSLDAKEAVFSYDPSQTDIEGILKAINDFGFTAESKR